MMKRFAFLIVLAFLTSACSGLQPTNLPAPPQINAEATIASIVQTSAVQTKTALPSPTIAPPTFTASATVAASPTLVPNETATSAPVATFTAVGTVATSEPTTIPPTATLAQAGGTATTTLTPGPLLYGTLPPAVAWGNVTIENKAKRDAYISLQLQNNVAEGAILEYPVKKSVSIDAPVGHYLYVVWVGGRQIVGEFKILKGEDYKILIFKDRVEIQ